MAREAYRQERAPRSSVYFLDMGILETHRLERFVDLPLGNHRLAKVLPPRSNAQTPTVDASPTQTPHALHTSAALCSPTKSPALVIIPPPAPFVSPDTVSARALAMNNPGAYRLLLRHGLRPGRNMLDSPSFPRRETFA